MGLHPHFISRQASGHKCAHTSSLETVLVGGTDLRLTLQLWGSTLTSYHGRHQVRNIHKSPARRQCWWEGPTLGSLSSCGAPPSLHAMADIRLVICTNLQPGGGDSGRPGIHIVFFICSKVHNITPSPPPPLLTWYSIHTGLFLHFLENTPPAQRRVFFSLLSGFVQRSQSQMSSI